MLAEKSVLFFDEAFGCAAIFAIELQQVNALWQCRNIDVRGAAVGRLREPNAPIDTKNADSTFGGGYIQVVHRWVRVEAYARFQMAIVGWGLTHPLVGSDGGYCRTRTPCDVGGDEIQRFGTDQVALVLRAKHIVGGKGNRLADVVGAAYSRAPFGDIGVLGAAYLTELAAFGIEQVVVESRDIILA